MTAATHVPVMLPEVLAALSVRPGGRYADGTLGGGGYAEAILSASGPGGLLLGLDRDGEAVGRASARLAPFGSRFTGRRANFSDLPAVLSELSWPPLDGVVLDLGVSSLQLDDPERGFSFLRDGPLDMRLDARLPRTAADLVNTLPEAELARILFEYGEERHARRIARALCGRRAREPFARTLDCAAVVSSAVPKSRDTARIHPATRTFQALRIAVNGELEALRAFLERVPGVLAPGGRCAVVSFHSLEDRMVKEVFRELTAGCVCPRGVPVCRCGREAAFRPATRRALRPSEGECERNPRARSARLRAVEKLS